MIIILSFSCIFLSIYALLLHHNFYTWIYNFSDRFYKNNYARPRFQLKFQMIYFIADIFVFFIPNMQEAEIVKKYSKIRKNLKFQTTNPINILFQKQVSKIRNHSYLQITYCFNFLIYIQWSTMSIFRTK